MTTTKVKATSLLALLAMVSFVSLTLAMSIEREPVKVTHRNSGPKYEIDEDKLTPTNPENEQSPSNKQDQNDNNNNNNNNNKPTGVRVFGGGSPAPAGDQQDPQEAFPIGHMTIRRIFLVPMMSPSRQDGDQAEPNSDPAQEQPSPLFPRPLWPFSLSPARHQPPHHHLFGQDEASRPPVDPKEREDANNDNSPAASGEREGERGPPERPMFDPIKMMIDMMQQAIAGQLAPPETSNPGGDLNTNEASDKPSSERDNGRPSSAAGPGELDRPMRPSNETKEDIVEIDGKKYLRKTIINRHVGENIIFMTKRLIFTPLNATDSNEAPITTTTTTTTTTTLKPTEEATEIPVKPTASPTEEPTSTTSTSAADGPATEQPAARTEQPTEVSSTTTTSEAPVSTSAGDQIASSSTTTTTTTSTEQPEETTIARDAGEVAKKAAERLTDSTITTN